MSPKDAASASEALLINGTVGVGKSTVAAHLGDVLAAQRVPHALIDLDHLRWSWPPPPDDPFNLTIELRNLTSVAANYRDAGIRRFVLAGVLERRTDLARYERAVQARVRVVRLRADPSLLQRRLRARHALDPAGLSWHLTRAGELDAILDAARVDDDEIHLGARDPQSIAVDLASIIGW